MLHLDTLPPPKIITFQGESLNESEWARKLGLSRQGLHERIKTMPLADALRPADGRRVVFTRKMTMWIEHEGRIYSRKHFAKLCGVTVRTIRAWTKAGHVRAFCETTRCCGHCGAPDHRVSNCPKVFLEPGGRRAPFSPPRDSELSALGVSTAPNASRPAKRPRSLPASAPPSPASSTSHGREETSPASPSAPAKRAPRRRK